MEDNLEEVEKLAKEKPPVWQNPADNDKTALHVAVEMAHKKCALILIEVCISPLFFPALLTLLI